MDSDDNPYSPELSNFYYSNGAVLIVITAFCEAEAYSVLDDEVVDVSSYSLVKEEAL